MCLGPFTVAYSLAAEDAVAFLSGVTTTQSIALQNVSADVVTKTLGNVVGVADDIRQSL
jgi:hypothetical protein